jgi:hypothetical protein
MSLRATLCPFLLTCLQPWFGGPFFDGSFGQGRALKDNFASNDDTGDHLHGAMVLPGTVESKGSEKGSTGNQRSSRIADDL